MIAVLDAGALIAIDRRDRTVGAMLRVRRRDSIPVHTSAAAVALVRCQGQRQANLARLLAGIDITALHDSAGRRVGELLRANNSKDRVNALVALPAEPDGMVLTPSAGSRRAAVARGGRSDR